MARSVAARIFAPARARLLDIWDYTERTWGARQADAYLRDLAAAITRHRRPAPFGVPSETNNSRASFTSTIATISSSFGNSPREKSESFPCSTRAWTSPPGYGKMPTLWKTESAIDSSMERPDQPGHFLISTKRQTPRKALAQMTRRREECPSSRDRFCPSAAGRIAPVCPGQSRQAKPDLLETPHTCASLVQSSQRRSSYRIESSRLAGPFPRARTRR